LHLHVPFKLSPRTRTPTRRWRDASFPHFQCVPKAAGVFDLAYTSKRGSLLMPFVQGLITTVAEELFDTPVDVIIEEAHDRGGRFSIRYRCSGNAASTSAASTSGAGGDSQSREAPPGTDDGRALPTAVPVAQDVLEQNGLGAGFLLDQWPFFLMMNENLDILAAGRSLLTKLPVVVPGTNFRDHFEVQRPATSRAASWDLFRKHNMVPYQVSVVVLDPLCVHAHASRTRSS